MKFSSDLPLYESIKREFQYRIESGELPVGERLMPEISLAAKLGVSRSTARKALQLLEEEGYISRTAGRGSFVEAPESYLGAQANKLCAALALIAPSCAENGQVRSLCQGFLCAALDANCAAVILPSDLIGRDERMLFLQQRAQGLKGWALYAPGYDQGWLKGFIELLGRLSPVVLIEPGEDALPCDVVASAEEEMALVLTRELLRRGHRAIGYITSAQGVAGPRHRGYTRALHEVGAAEEASLWVVNAMEDQESLHLKLLALMGQRTRPTALLCADSHPVSWLLESLSRLNYARPADIELAVLDDQGGCAALETPMIWARSRAEELGRRALALLRERLENGVDSPRKRLVSYEVNFSQGG